MDHDHDGAYKLLFSQPRLVADLLSGFVREPWVEQADLSTLEKMNPTYVGDDLRHREDDLVWRLRWGGNRWLYVYLILEFQSRVDPFMAVRVLTYLGLLYQDLIRRRELAPGGRLPPVLPLVLYNGGRPWRAAKEIGGLVAKVPGGLAGYRPRLRYLLLEEQRLASADPAVPNLAAALFELERCREPEEIRTVIARLVEWLPAPEARELRRAFATWLRRVLLPDRLPQASGAEVADLAEVKTMLEQNMIAWRQRVVREVDEIRREADKIRRETDEIRRETDEIRQQGLQQGQATLLLRQLESRFGELPSAARRRVESAGSDQLLAWGERLLEAQRLEDVFAS